MVTSITSNQHGYGATTRCSNQWSPPLHLNNMAMETPQGVGNQWSPLLHLNNMAMEPPQGVVINVHLSYI